MTGSRSSGERLRVGIVGGGAITQVAHLPVLKKLKTIEVPAICDTDLPKARALADRFGVKDAFDDIEDLLRYEALDAVVICSPNHLHESHILSAPPITCTSPTSWRRSRRTSTCWWRSRWRCRRRAPSASCGRSRSATVS
jgi:hypothetical protein